jgi:membrane-bound lytic murein transglycosylase B
MKAALLLACLAGVTLAAQSPTPPATAQPQPETRPSFAEWLDQIRTEALSRGIRQDVVDQALGEIDEPVTVVIERDRAQAEAVLSLDQYIARRLTPPFIRAGRENFAREKATLDAVSRQYGVPSRILTSIWGIESNYGRFTGVRPTVSALATLAYDPRRSTLFRRELFDALEILNRNDIEFAAMKGSWAGAMGQPQFMPSSYLQFAVDFDGDGRRDIWSTNADIFASIANYLRGKGWVDGEDWGHEVRTIPNASARIAKEVARRDGTCRAMRDMTVALPLTEWQRLGVRTIAGGPLPYTEQMASLVTGTRRKFLVYRNYDAILDYNCANSYALTVALLSDEIAAPEKPAPKPAPKAAPKAPAARRTTPPRQAH